MDDATSRPPSQQTPATGAFKRPESSGSIPRPEPRTSALWMVWGWVRAFGRAVRWVWGGGGERIRWGQLFSEKKSFRLLFQIFLFHVRYTFGYLAAGFLVSVPVQLVASSEGTDGRIFSSLAMGLACTIPFIALWPFTLLHWERMRLPEFKNLELAWTRWGVYAALGFLLLSVGTEIFTPKHWLAHTTDPRVAYLVLVLMLCAWARVKFHTFFFRDFYKLKEGDDLVLALPEREPTPTPAPAEELASEEAEDPEPSEQPETSEEPVAVAASADGRD